MPEFERVQASYAELLGFTQCRGIQKSVLRILEGLSDWPHATRGSLDKLQGTLKRCSELFCPTRHFEIPGIRYEVRFIASGAGRTREDQGSGLWSSTLPSGCTGESEDSGG